MSLNMVARQTGVRQMYLESIESGRYNELPGEVYALEYVKKYARFLRLDPNEAGRAYNSERSCDKRLWSNYRQSAPSSRMKFLTSSRKYFFVKSFLGIFSAGVLAYLFIFLNNFFASPVLEIFSPQQYTKTQDSRIVLRGRVENVDILYLNNEPIAIQEGDEFAESFYLPPGLSVLELQAFGKMGKKSIQYLSIMVQTPKDDALVLQSGL